MEKVTFVPRIHWHGMGSSMSSQEGKQERRRNFSSFTLMAVLMYIRYGRTLQSVPSLSLLDENIPWPLGRSAWRHAMESGKWTKEGGKDGRIIIVVIIRKVARFYCSFPPSVNVVDLLLLSSFVHFLPPSSSPSPLHFKCRFE